MKPKPDTPLLLHLLSLWRAKAKAVALLFLLLFSVALVPDSYAQGPQETVVLLHGYGRSSDSMWLLEKRLVAAGYKVVLIDYPSFENKPELVVTSVHQKMAAASLQGAMVHFVGHSMGGLMIRSFLQQQQLGNRLGQVVMLGTPNQGSKLAENYREHWLAKKVSGLHLILGTSETGLAKQLETPDYSVGVIAGVKKYSLVTGLVGGENDGLVSVASAQLPGLTDFIKLPVGHAMMRYDSEVARQTIHFLQHGQFKHKEKGSESEELSDPL